VFDMYVKGKFPKLHAGTQIPCTNFISLSIASTGEVSE
jgi:hypothetical protein